MPADTLGDLAFILRAYGLRADLALRAGAWWVHIWPDAGGPGVTVAAETLEVAIDSAVNTAVRLHEHRRTA